MAESSSKRTRAPALHVVPPSWDDSRLLIESIVADHVIYMLDVGGHVLTWNLAAEEISGYRADEVIGQHFSRFFTSEGAATGSPDRLLEIASATGRCEDEGWRVRKDGSRSWTNVVITALRDASGALRGFGNVMHDRKRRETKPAPDAIQRLHAISSLRVSHETLLQPVLTEIVDAAISLGGADFGNIQLLDAKSGALEIVAHQGLPRWWLDFWHRVVGRGSCGTALGCGETVVVEDVERSTIFVGTPALEAQLKAGIRACISVPIVRRSGKPIGMLNIDYRAPHRPDEHTLRVLDLVARQAADIVERWQVGRELEQATTIVQRSPQLTWLTDAASVGTFVNQSLLDFTGRPREELVGHHLPLLSVMHPDDVSVFKAALNVSDSAGTSFRREVRLRNHEGVYAWHGVHVEPVCDDRGRRTGWLGFADDIDVLRQLAEADANRAKDEFLVLLGHELRDPLAPMLNALQLIAQRDDAALQPEREVLERQVRHLTRVVDDLLDVSRVARKRLSLDRELMEISDVVGKSIEMLAPLVEQRGQHLRVHMDRRRLFLNGDAARLAQVFSNLLTHAAKHTPERGTITVTVEQSDGDVVVRVSDTGVGIAPEHLARIFDLFSDRERTLAGGLGTGLALVRSFVELHGGSVSAESAGVGHGSQFTVRLPRVVPEDAQSSTSRLNGHEPILARPRGRRVLVVDDNVDAAQMLVSALKAIGCEVLKAHDGRAAVEASIRLAPEVVFLDLGLPLMNGYEVAEKLRNDLGTSVRLIALTGYGQEADRERAREAGFDDHFVKPLDIDALPMLLGGDTES